ncbi:DUF3800 domain-containing protein [Salicola sp. Rm-C-2C1-2]|uniref:DUF3800 domain-containing protein n=1 Tax=Salicola sp. Rm-C-2C1-2 TaxID=3141321 RepID=UPI0032E426CE
MIQVVAFDESGNTGSDLLNADQPVFCLASTSLSSSDADEILYAVRTAQASEVKYSRLKRSASGRGKILKLLADERLDGSNVKTTFYHKRFMVVTKVVDLLVETLAHRDGIDLYKDGANIALSHLHFYCMPVFCGEQKTRAFLDAFVDMIRTGDRQTIEQFYQAAWVIHDNCSNHEYRQLLAPIIASQELIGEVLRANDRNSLDPAIPAFVQHCAFWGDELGGEFDVLHDDSKPLFEEKESLEKLLSRGEEERVVGYDRRQFVFPLRAREVQFGSSHSDPRLQLVDVVASAAAQWMSGFAMSPRDREFWQGLHAANLVRFGRDAVWPTPEVTPDELDTRHEGGQSVVDGVTEFLERYR